MVMRLKNLVQMKKLVEKGKHLGDFLIVAGVRYQIVEYSMESHGKGSRWVTYYNPYTGDQLYIDYAEGTIDSSKSWIAWEKDMSLDMKWLKGRKK